MVERPPPYRDSTSRFSRNSKGSSRSTTDNNVRVRSVRARITELKRQLEKLGGKGEQASEQSGQQADYLYPSIRKLPLLAVTYADLYRRTRVQEAVFETLTKQYELARVQEAKEIQRSRCWTCRSFQRRGRFHPGHWSFSSERHWFLRLPRLGCSAKRLGSDGFERSAQGICTGSISDGEGAPALGVQEWLEATLRYGSGFGEAGSPRGCGEFRGISDEVAVSSWY